MASSGHNICTRCHGWRNDGTSQWWQVMDGGLGSLALMGAVFKTPLLFDTGWLRTGFPYWITIIHYNPQYIGYWYGIASVPCRSLISYNACHIEIPRAHDDSNMINYLSQFLLEHGVPVGFASCGVTFGFCGVTFWWRCAMRWGDLWCCGVRKGGHS